MRLGEAIKCLKYNDRARGKRGGFLTLLAGLGAPGAADAREGMLQTAHLTVMTTSNPLAPAPGAAESPDPGGVRPVDSGLLAATGPRPLSPALGSPGAGVTVRWGHTALGSGERAARGPESPSLGGASAGGPAGARRALPPRRDSAGLAPAARAPERPAPRGPTRIGRAAAAGGSRTRSARACLSLPLPYLARRRERARRLRASWGPDQGSPRPRPPRARGPGPAPPVTKAGPRPDTGGAEEERARLRVAGVNVPDVGRVGAASAQSAAGPPRRPPQERGRGGPMRKRRLFRWGGLRLAGRRRGHAPSGPAPKARLRCGRLRPAGAPASGPRPGGIFHLQGCPQIFSYSHGDPKGRYRASAVHPDTPHTSRPHTFQESAPRRRSPARSRSEPAVSPLLGTDPYRTQKDAVSAQDPFTELYLLYSGRVQRWAELDAEAPGRWVENAAFGARHTWFNSQQILFPAAWAWATQGNPDGIHCPICKMRK